MPSLFLLHAINALNNTLRKPSAVKNQKSNEYIYIYIYIYIYKTLKPFD